MKNKSETLSQITRGIILSSFVVLALTNNILPQVNSIKYSLFIGVNGPIQPNGFDNYYLDGFSGGGVIEKPINSKWSVGVKTEFARYYPDIEAVTDWHNEVSVDFIPNDVKYHLNSYAITAVLRRQFGNPKEDMRFFTEFEVGPHLFTGSGWGSVPIGLREEIEVSREKVQFGAAIGAGIKWDWDDKYATFVQVGWHKILSGADSKNYIPLMAGIKF